MFGVTHVLILDFRLRIVNFDMCQDCGRKRPAASVGYMRCRCQLLSTALLLIAHTKTLQKMDGILTKERFRLFSLRCIF